MRETKTLKQVAAIVIVISIIVGGLLLLIDVTNVIIDRPTKQKTMTITSVNFTTEELIMLYNAIFEDTGIKLTDGTIIPVKKQSKNLRSLEFRGVTFIEQNPNKDSSYAKLAREGHRLMWGIRDPNWILVQDGIVVKP